MYFSSTFFSEVIFPYSKHVENNCITDNIEINNILFESASCDNSS